MSVIGRGLNGFPISFRPATIIIAKTSEERQREFQWGASAASNHLRGTQAAEPSTPAP